MVTARDVAAAVLIIDGGFLHYDAITYLVVKTNLSRLGRNALTPENTMNRDLSKREENPKKRFFSESDGSGFYCATDAAKADKGIVRIVEDLNLKDYGINNYRDFQYEGERSAVNAINVVSAFYKKQEWWKQKALNKSDFEKFGFDLRCVKGTEKKSVVVKTSMNWNGISFVITADEIMEALVNPDFVIHVVVSPDDEPEHFCYSGREFVSKFKIERIAYDNSEPKVFKYLATSLDEM